MAVIGIDTHKRTLAACALDDIGVILDERVVACSADGFAALAAWIREQASAARIGVEGSASYGPRWPGTSSSSGMTSARCRPS